MNVILYCFTVKMFIYGYRNFLRELFNLSICFEVLRKSRTYFVINTTLFCDAAMFFNLSNIFFEAGFLNIYFKVFKFLLWIDGTVFAFLAWISIPFIILDFFNRLKLAKARICTPKFRRKPSKIVIFNFVNFAKMFPFFFITPHSAAQLEYPIVCQQFLISTMGN